MKRINNILSNEIYKNHVERLQYYEKDREFCCHDMEHFLSVARIMIIKSQEEHLTIAKDIIYAVAMLHDIGRVLQYEEGMEHSKAGVEIASRILLECQYTKTEIKIITDAIAEHNNRDEGHPINKLLRYADKISRNCFACTSYDLCNWEESKKNKGIIL